LEYGSTNKRLYIGNLSWTTTEEGLGQALGQNGRTVASVKIKTDTKTGRSRGFAFAELGSEEEAHAAIEELHGTELDGRPLKVSTANVKKVHTGGFGKGDKGGYGDRGGDRGGYGGGGRGGRGGGGGGGGGRW
jgi:RNA recognition motif-containing protein